MSIRLLSDQLVSQIAAGEVVERPASVVKELLENALDAGASEIRLEIAQGGRKLIRISDNGSGIPASEVELAFTRHATSKIASADDLSHILTLGFRGEALASIAAVARITCITRARGEEVGTQIRLASDGPAQRSGIGAPAGTTISVEDLFHSVPARLKFLKAEGTERRHIDALVTRYALAYPAVRFRLTHDGRTTFETTGSGNLLDVIVALYGLSVAQSMLPVSSGDADSVQVEGYVSSPSLSRANRNDLTIFVNGRWVQDRNLSWAVVQAYHSMLMVGRYPVCFLQVHLPPAEVDVNVHPAKSEVRFRNPDDVFRAVQRAVRRVLVAGSPVPSVSAGSEAAEDPRPDDTSWPTPETSGHSPIDWPAALSETESDGRTPPPEGDRSGSRIDRLRTLGAPGLPQHPAIPFAFPAPAPEPPAEPAPASPGLPLITPQLPALRVLGQIGSTYIVAEGPEGMYLVDQHAAHERVLYEKFMAERGRGVPVQNLLDPRPVEVPIESVGLLTDHLDMLAGLGVQLEPFGGTTFLVRSVPGILASQDPQIVVNDIVSEIDLGDTPMEADEEARLIRRVCKRAAIKAGQTLSMVEMQELIRQLEACASPRTCPHGRPTMIHMSGDRLAREFGRK